MHRRFHDQFNIVSDSLLVAQIASALSNLKISLPDQFNASLLDESAEKKKKKKKEKKTRNKITHHHHHHHHHQHHHYFVLLKYSRTSSKRQTNTAF